MCNLNRDSVKLVHYSDTHDLSILSGRKHGSGPGYGQERLRAMLPDYNHDRVYFYPASDDRPEKQLTPCKARYEASVPRNSLYVLSQDRYKLYDGDVTAWENAILAFGYPGYIRADGIMVVFGDVLVTPA